MKESKKEREKQERMRVKERSAKEVESMICCLVFKGGGVNLCVYKWPLVTV